MDLTRFLRRMTNVNLAAKAPLGIAGMVSSHDRSGGNRDWADFDVAPADDGLVDIAAIEGPGVIHRVWWTGHNASQWKLFIDGASEPVIDGLYAWDDRPAGDSSQAFAAPLSGKASGGAYSYVPIPFARSIRIAVPGDYKPARPYFQINYEHLPDRRVVSFPPQLSATENRALSDVRSWWNTLSSRVADEVEGLALDASSEIGPGQTNEIARVAPGRCLDRFAIQLPPRGAMSSTAYHHLLRDLDLICEYGPNRGFVVPLGDFFCNAFAYRSYASQFLACEDGVYLCRFPMPAPDGLTLSMRNAGDMPVVIKSGFSVRELKRGETRVFVAGFRQLASYDKPPGRALTAFRAKGAGHIVGSYVVSHGTDGTWNLLEGDDQVFVDGDLKPTLHGTGLEDYFNGAWYYTGMHDMPFSGLLEKAAMQTCQYRLHGPDPIGFENEVRFKFEFGHVLGTQSGPNTSRGYMSSTVYAYLDTPPEITALPANIRVPPSQVSMGAAQAGIMELEAAGLWDEARRRSQWLSEQPGQLRAEHYRLRTEIYEHRDKHWTGTIDTAGYSAAMQATIGQWNQFLGATNRVLIGVQATHPYQAYWDGSPVLSGGNPARLDTGLATRGDTNHVFALRFQHGNPDPFIGAALLMRDQLIELDTSWWVSMDPPPDWPRVRLPLDDSVWKPLHPPVSTRPQLAYWQFEPNAHVALQKGEILKPRWQLDKDGAKAATYLVRIIEPAAAAPPPNPTDDAL